MKIKKVLKDKKGAVLEMSIFFMIIIFTFCTLLTTMTLTARSRIKIEKAYLDMDLNTDRILENYLYTFEQAIINKANLVVIDPDSNTKLYKVEEPIDSIPGVVIEEVTGNGIEPDTKYKFVIKDGSNVVILEVVYEIRTNKTGPFPGETEPNYSYTIFKTINKLNENLLK
ncbi:MAG: hypothetical protein IIX44_05060 [Clostridia bacterium]|nr:hypothetical protein [Clostridia bacterium]